jgi:LacI family transcriptional regulator/LacI family repressor for deo operon, udp, cdd, tsx, nupC, and nupG
MVLPSVVRTRNPELISGAEETVREAGGSLMLGISGDERWLETEQIERISSQGATGLIVYPVDGSLEVPMLHHLLERGFPLVLIDRYIPDLPVDVVSIDNVGGAFQSVQHLAVAGYRRIGYVGTKNVGTSSVVERIAGYRWALSEYGLAYEEDLVCAGLERLLAWPPREPIKERANDQMLREYFDRPTRPRAIYA